MPPVAGRSGGGAGRFLGGVATASLLLAEASFLILIACATLVLFSVLGAGVVSIVLLVASLEVSFSLVDDSSERSCFTLTCCASVSCA